MSSLLLSSAPQLMASSVSLRGAILQRPHLRPRPDARRAPTTRRRAVPAKICCIGWVILLLVSDSVVYPSTRPLIRPAGRPSPVSSFLTTIAFGAGLGRTPRASWARRRAATSRASSSAAASRGTPRRARTSSARCARRRSGAAASARCVRDPSEPLHSSVPYRRSVFWAPDRHVPAVQLLLLG